jgi:tripartite ATP-independent transporter DctP family solute receptor
LRKHKKTGLIALGLVGTLAMAACGADDAGGADGDEGGSGKTVTLSFANSYPESHPHNRCGAQVVADKLAKSGTGLEIEIFPNSSLGPDADRFESVVSGDIDIDIQGSSAIAASYPEIGALDAAYLMDGPDQLFDFLDSEVFEQVQADLVEATGVRALDGWFFGMRQFTANKPIRTPDDLEGLRMRFPDSPQYLQNAKALGAQAVPVAFEEVYLSLQQGVIDGQENPVPTINDLNLPEVQSHVSMTAHQTGFVLAIINEDTWQSLTSEQQQALQEAISSTREGDRTCIEDDERKLLDEWKANGTVTVVDDVDREAFSQQAEKHFVENMEGSTLELYQEIRDLAQ